MAVAEGVRGTTLFHYQVAFRMRRRRSHSQLALWCSAMDHEREVSSLCWHMRKREQRQRPGKVPRAGLLKVPVLASDPSAPHSLPLVPPFLHKASPRAAPRQPHHPSTSMAEGWGSSELMTRHANLLGACKALPRYLRSAGAG